MIPEVEPAVSPNPDAPDRNLAMELVRVTEAAALASGKWVGRGQKESGDGAAVDAMRMMINSVEMDGVVVIGEGEKMKPQCCTTVSTSVQGTVRQ